MCIAAASSLVPFSLFSAEAHPPAVQARIAIRPVLEDDAPPSEPEVLVDGVRVRTTPVKSPAGGRTLLVIVDPGAEARSEVRSQLRGLIRALSPAFPAGVSGVRLGFPVIAGILTPRYTDPRSLESDLDRSFASYFPQNSGEYASLPRTIDLIATLVENAEKEDGPIGGLLLFKDRSFSGEEAPYLSLGTERLLGSLCLRHGSVLHGYLGGAGILGEVLEQSGGIVFTWKAAPEEVIGKLSSGTVRARILEIEVERDGAAGALPITLRSGAGIAFQHARTLWLHPDGAAPPNHHAIRSSLDWLRRAREADDAQNLTQTLRFAEAALQEDPWSTQACVLGGRAARASGDLAAAGRYLERALGLGATDDATVREFAAVFRALGKPDQALVMLERAMSRGMPRSPSIETELASLNAEAGRPEIARQLFSAIMQRGEDGDRAHSELAWLLLKSGQVEEAVSHSRIALGKNPNNARALLCLAESAAAGGAPKESLEFARRAEAADPRNPGLHVALGRVAEIRRDWTSAEECYRRALDLAPQREDAWRGLAEALANGGQVQQGAEILIRHLSETPPDAAGYRHLSDLHFRHGDLGAAAAVLESGAVRTAEASFELYREAAELRERRGELGQALLDYRAMSRSAPAAAAARLRTELSTHIGALQLLIEPGTAPENIFPVAAEIELPALSGLVRKVEPADTNSAAPEDATIPIPGGLALFARTTGIRADALRAPGALQHLIQTILESGFAKRDDPASSVIVRDTLAFLRAWNGLLAHMKKCGLLPANSDLSKGVDVAFPLGPEKESMKRTRDFLRFFGIGISVRRAKNGAPVVNLTLRQSTSNAARQQLLRNLGVNILDPRQREIKIRLIEERIPIVMGARTWSDEILAGSRKRASASLLERLISNGNSMRLYLALAECPEPTRIGLLRASNPPSLLSQAQSLLRFGRYLEFQDGNLRLPGDPGAWESLLGLPSGATSRDLLSALLTRDNGRALPLYYALGSAPPEVRQYFAAPGRLEKLYPILSDANRPNGQDYRMWASSLTLARVLRQLQVRDQNLVIFSDPQLGKALGFKPAGGRLGSDAFLVEASDVPGLADPRGSKSSTLDLVRFLRGWNPDMFSAEIIDILLKEPVQAPFMLDLILDLHPSAAQLLDYFTVARSVSRGGEGPRQVDRARITQALLHLIALLRREGSLTSNAGQQLLSSALKRLGEKNDREFYFGISDFISKELLPALPKSAAGGKEADPLMAALAGSESAREFPFEGKRYRSDRTGYRLERMRATVLHQSYMPLSEVLEALRRAREAASLKVGPALDALRRATSVIPVLAPSPTAGNEQTIAAARAAALRSKLENAAKSKIAGALNDLVGEATANLGIELGVTLLTYCYAYYGTPEVDLLAFDPYFVRKHDFYGQKRSGSSCWAPALLTQSEGAGSYCTGSISGLGLELANLEAAQSFQAFGKQEGRLMVPTLLSALRSMQQNMDGDGAQEYVVLAVRLARELLASAAFDSAIYRWCESFLNTHIPPRRRLLALASIREGRPLSAAELLSPSELFLVGEAYQLALDSDAWLGGALAPDFPSNPGSGPNSSPDRDADGVNPVTRPPTIGGPTLRRIRALITSHAGLKAAAFRQEVDQYGPLLRTRTGLWRSSFTPLDSFERLETELGDPALFDRLCDLKIRIAEINLSLGLPAWISPIQGELALREILPRGESIRTGSWTTALELIGRLNPEMVQGWMEELVNRGILSLPAEKSDTGATAP